MEESDLPDSEPVGWNKLDPPIFVPQKSRSKGIGDHVAPSSQHVQLPVYSKTMVAQTALFKEPHAAHHHSPSWKNSSSLTYISDAPLVEPIGWLRKDPPLFKTRVESAPSFFQQKRSTIRQLLGPGNESHKAWNSSWENAQHSKKNEKVYASDLTYIEPVGFLKQEPPIYRDRKSKPQTSSVISQDTKEGLSKVPGKKEAMKNIKQPVGSQSLLNATGSVRNLDGNYIGHRLVEQKVPDSKTSPNPRYITRCSDVDAGGCVKMLEGLDAPASLERKKTKSGSFHVTGSGRSVDPSDLGESIQWGRI